MTLRPYARELVHRTLTSTRSTVDFDTRNDYTKSDARRAYLVAEELWREYASMFARFTLDGDGTADALVPVLKLAHRYRNVCKIAYLGSEHR